MEIEEIAISKRQVKAAFKVAAKQDPRTLVLQAYVIGESLITTDGHLLMAQQIELAPDAGFAEEDQEITQQNANLAIAKPGIGPHKSFAQVKTATIKDDFKSSIEYVAGLASPDRIKGAANITFDVGVLYKLAVALKAVGDRSVTLYIGKPDAPVVFRTDNPDQYCQGIIMPMKTNPYGLPPVENLGKVVKEDDEEDEKAGQKEENELERKEVSQL